MSHKAQGRRHDDDSDNEQELHDKKFRNSSGGSNGYSKSKPSNRKGSDDDSDSDDYASKSKASHKSDKKYDSKNKRNDDSGSGEEEKGNGGKSETYEVIIKGLPFSSSDQDINDFFQDCGEIDRVNLLKGGDGRSKGIAFVKFFDEKSLKKAIELDGNELGGRTVHVEKTVPKEQRGGDRGDRGDRGGDRNDRGGDRQRSERDPNSTTVFVGNLSYGTDQESLREIFEPCGKIKEVRIAMDQDGKPRGFGYVEFGSADSVDKAMQMTGNKLDGRSIRVDFTNSRKNDGGGSRSFGGGRDSGRGGRNGGGGGYGGGGNRRGGNRY